MKPRKGLIIAIVILAFCVLNYIHLIPSQVAAEGSKTTYPNLLNIMMAVFAVLYALEALWQMKTQTAEASQNKASGPGFFATYGRTLLLILVTAIWVFSMEAGGFILSTFFFLLAASFIFGARSTWKPLMLSVMMPLIFYAIFRSLNSMLPEGPVENLLGMLFG